MVLRTSQLTDYRILGAYAKPELSFGVDRYNSTVKLPGNLPIPIKWLIQGWMKLRYLTEPPSTGWNALRYASEPPVPASWNKLLYAGE